MKNEKAFAPLLIIIPIALLFLGAVAFFTLTNKPNSKNDTPQPANTSPVDNSFITAAQKCIETDSAGCDNDPDVDEWEDDNLP